MRVCLTHLGCKLNQAEVERLARDFAAAGHQVVARLDEADLHVLNTCTVTATAAQQSRQLARRGGRLRPGLRTVLTGCYATGSAAEAAALAGVDLVVPNAEKHRLVERVEAALPELAARSPRAGSPSAPASPYAPFGPPLLEVSSARATVKVGDGCNYRCAFCIIPFTRGRETSRPLAEVVAEVDGLVRAGYPEIVLTGVQISDYRDGGSRLVELIAALLAGTAVARLRLTSIAPWDLDPRLLGAWSDRRLCRHVHLSLQSGCSATLRRMRRPYTAERFAEVRRELAAAVPGIAVSTDVIVGFPGETDAEHEESLAFVAAQGFARVHLFPFSARPGTAAATLPGQVPPALRRERMERLAAVARASETRFAERFLGEEAEVLWESERDGVWQGLTDNYLRVFASAGGPRRRTSSRVRLVERVDGGLRGVLLPSCNQ